MRSLLWVASLLAVLALSGCGYNDFQTKDEQVKAAWSEVLNQYKRRADLIPNLVATVQGYASQEKDVLLGVTQARAKAGSVRATRTSATCRRSSREPRTASPPRATDSSRPCRTTTSSRGSSPRT